MSARAKTVSVYRVRIARRTVEEREVEVVATSERAARRRMHAIVVDFEKLDEDEETEGEWMPVTVGPVAVLVVEKLR